MMRLAERAGIGVPPVRLVHRDQLIGVPAHVWPEGEEWAYAIHRFDRGSEGSVHIEDLAQVRNVYPNYKYTGNYETVASLVYRGHDLRSLREFARRLVFMTLTANGDGHLKNWSLVYHDTHRPTLTPAYDLVATAPYRVNGAAEDLALKFGGTKRFDRVCLGLFRRLERRLAAHEADLTAIVVETVDRVVAHWPETMELLSDQPDLARQIGEAIRARRATVLGRSDR